MGIKELSDSLRVSSQRRSNPVEAAGDGGEFTVELKNGNHFVLEAVENCGVEP